MEDGSSMPLAGVIILLLLLWLNGIFYGFSAAVHNLSGSEVEKRAQEGDKKSTYLLSLMNSPMTFVNAIPLIKPPITGVEINVTSLPAFKK